MKSTWLRLFAAACLFVRSAPGEDDFRQLSPITVDACSILETAGIHVSAFAMSVAPGEEVRVDIRLKNGDEDLVLPLSSIAPSVDSEQREVPVIITIQEQDDREVGRCLRIGMTVDCCGRSTKIPFTQFEVFAGQALILSASGDVLLAGSEAWAVPDPSKLPVALYLRITRTKKTANQALQTTSVTRSGFGKVSVSDRQRRGV